MLITAYFCLKILSLMMQKQCKSAERCICRYAYVEKNKFFTKLDDGRWGADVKKSLQDNEIYKNQFSFFKTIIEL
jgi:hypothetical protein